MNIVYTLNNFKKETQAYPGKIIERDDNYIIEGQEIDIILKDIKKINLIKYSYGTVIEIIMNEKIYICVPTLYINIGTGFIIINNSKTIKLFNKFKEIYFYKKMKNSIIKK